MEENKNIPETEPVEAAEAAEADEHMHMDHSKMKA